VVELSQTFSDPSDSGLGIASRVEIAGGVRMPLLGLGTYKSAPGDETGRAVLTALEVGYRSIDTASLYGNEESVGAAVRASGIPRAEIFVATKVWNDDQGYSETLRAFERSLRKLDLDYVDLYLVHWHIPQLSHQTWRAMEYLLAHDGRVRAIGVCNHLAHHLEALLHDASVAPAVNQVEFHVRLQQPELQRFCAANRIRLEAWAPLMRGGVAGIDEVTRIATQRRKTPAQIALRWLLQKGVVAIPKSVHAERIRENGDIFDFDLEAEEMSTLDSLDAGQRLGPDPDRFGT
jgi:diketogulonate reductase-like aldo/keto reductase